jgi:hypothetical protein
MPDVTQPMTIIEQADQAAYLTNLENLIYLEPFLGQEIAVAEAAIKANVKPHQMFYQVGKLQKLGLIRMVRNDLQSGKRVKLYQASSMGFFVPLAVTPFENLSAFFRASSTIMLDAQCDSQAKTLLKYRSDSDYGFKITTDGEDLNFNLAPITPTATSDPNRLSEMPMVMGFGRLRMSRKKAEELRTLLQELNETTEEDDGDYYIFRVAFVPEVST